METISFSLIAVGAFVSMLRRAQRTGGGQLPLFDLLATLTVMFVASLSAVSIFIGPVGDARSYHEDINACMGQLPPCSNKLHEVIWGFVSTFIGPAWGFVYGYAISTALSIVARGRMVSKRAPIIAVLFLYCAYQIGNGMAEGTYFLLVLGALRALYAQQFIWGSVLLLGSVAAHLGNLPFLAFLVRFPRGWPTVIVGLTSAFLIAVIWGGLGLEDLLSITNKAAALISQDATYAAIEGKLRVSVRDADTSYAELLLQNGFPYTQKSIFYSVFFYIAPVFAASDSLIGFAVSLFSTVISLAVVWVSRDRPILLLITIMSFAIFAVASFTPGISLRHKVPLFLFVLAVRNPFILKGSSWRISR